MSCVIEGYNVTVSTGTCDDAQNLHTFIGFISFASLFIFLIFALVSFCAVNIKNIKDAKDAVVNMSILGILYGLGVLFGCIAGVLTIVLTVNISESVGLMWVGWVAVVISLLSLVGLLGPWC